VDLGGFLKTYRSERARPGESCPPPPRNQLDTKKDPPRDTDGRIPLPNSLVAPLGEYWSSYGGTRHGGKRNLGNEQSILDAAIEEALLWAARIGRRRYNDIVVHSDPTVPLPELATIRVRVPLSNKIYRVGV